MYYNCKVSYKFNKQLSRSCAYKVHDPPFHESISWIISPFKLWTASIFLHAHLQVVYYKYHKNPISHLGGVALTRYMDGRTGWFLYTVLAVDDRHVAFCEYNGSVARIICVAVATLANETLLERASDNDLLLCRKSTSNKTCYRQWFDRCIISKMILKSGSNWLFPVVFSVEITLSGSHSGNSFEFSHRLTGFLNYVLFCLSCLRLNLKPVNYLTTRRSSMTNSRSLYLLHIRPGSVLPKSGSIRPDNYIYESYWK